MATTKYQTELVITTAGNDRSNASRIQEVVRARVEAERALQQTQAAALNSQAAVAAPMGLDAGHHYAAGSSQPFSRHAAQKLRARLKQQARAQMQADAAANPGAADAPDFAASPASISATEGGATYLSRYARQSRIAAERLARRGTPTRSVFTSYPSPPTAPSISSIDDSDYVRTARPQWGPLRAAIDSLSPFGAGLARFGGMLRSRLGAADDVLAPGSYSAGGMSSNGFMARLRRQLAGISAAFRMRSSSIDGGMGQPGFGGMGPGAAPVTEYASWARTPLSPLGDTTAGGMNTFAAQQLTAQLAANPMVAAAAAQAAANTPQARQTVASQAFPALLSKFRSRGFGGTGSRLLPGGMSPGFGAYSGTDDDSSGYTYEPVYGRFILPTPRQKLPRPKPYLPVPYQPNLPVPATGMPEPVPPYWRYRYPGPPPLQLPYTGMPEPVPPYERYRYPGPPPLRLPGPGGPGDPGGPNGPAGPSWSLGPPSPPRPPIPVGSPGSSSGPPSPLLTKAVKEGVKYLYKRGLELQKLADPVYAEMEPMFARELQEMQVAGLYQYEDLAGEQEDFKRLRLAGATPGEHFARGTKDAQGNRIDYTSMSDRMDATGEVLTDLATKRMSAIRRHLQPFMGLEEGMHTYNMFRRNAGIIDMTSEDAASIIGTGLQSGLDPSLMAAASRVAAVPGMRGGGMRRDMHGMPDPAAIRYQQETLARGGMTGAPASHILQETLQRQSALAAVGVRSDFDRDALFQRTMQQQNVPGQEFSNIMNTLTGMRMTAIERNIAPRKEALSSILEAAAYAGAGSPEEALDYMTNTSDPEQLQNAIKRGYLTDPAMINYVAAGLSPANRKQMYETLRAVGGGATEGQAKASGELTLDPMTWMRKLFENNKTWNALGAQSDSEKLRAQAEVGDTIDSLAKAMRATIDALVEFGADLVAPQSGAVWAGNVGMGTD